MAKTKLKNMTAEEIIKSIEKYLKDNKIKWKYNEEYLIVYPSDFKKIDISSYPKFSNSLPYKTLLKKIYEEDDYQDEDFLNIHSIEFDPYGENDFKANFIEDIFKELLKIHNTLNKEFYYSEDDLILRKAEQIKRKRNLDSHKNAEKMFNDTLKELRISEEEFLDLSTKYKILKNIKLS